MRTTKIKAKPILNNDNTLRFGDKEEYTFHFAEVGNNIVLFPCFDGKVLRYETIHEFFEEWKLVEKL